MGERCILPVYLSTDLPIPIFTCFPISLISSTRYYFMIYFSRTIQRIRKGCLEHLKTLHRNAVLAGSLEEFERLVEQILRGEEE